MPAYNLTITTTLIIGTRTKNIGTYMICTLYTMLDYVITSLVFLSLVCVFLDNKFNY